MVVFERVVAAIVAALAYDWLGVTGSAAKFTGFDYQYLPMTKMRQASVLLMIVAGSLFATTINPDKPSLIPLFILAAVLVFHAYIAIQDMFSQRRNGQGDQLAADEENGS